MIDELPFLPIVAPQWFPMAYHADERKVFITSPESTPYQLEMIECNIDPMLTHETLHAILHEVQDERASRYLDVLETFEDLWISDYHGL